MESIGLPSISVVLTLMGVIALFALAPTMLFRVHGKTAAILETLGKPQRRARLPGLRMKAPWPFTQVVAKVNLKQQEYGANIEVKTKDNTYVRLPVKVQYVVANNSESPVLAHYELENPEEQIGSYVLNNVRQTASGMSLDQLFENRDQLEQQVKSSLNELFASFGHQVVNVLVDQPQPSKEIQDASNRVKASERLKEAAENEAKAIRAKLVGAAEAEAESKKLQGEGMAKMREAVALGLEKSMETMKQAGLTPQEAMAFLTETNRLDTITNAAAHGNMIIVDTRSDTKIGETIAAVRAAERARDTKSTVPHASEYAASANGHART